MAHTALRTQVALTLMRSMESNARVFLGVRTVAVVILLPALAGVLAWGGDAGWRLWVLGVVELGLLGSIAFEIHRPVVTPRRLMSWIALVGVLHTAIIVTTGGVESPFLPVYIPVTVMLAVAIGRTRALLLNVAFLAALVGIFLVIRWSGGGIEVPAVLRSAPAPFDPVYASLVGVFVVLFIAIGGSLGLYLRGILDTAAVEVANARTEILRSVRAQNRELSTLSGALAHELKNPLAAITSLSDLVARKLPPNSREAEQMGVLTGEVHRLADILDEFLNLSRPADGLNAVTVDPAQIVDGVARLYAAQPRPVEISTECHACAPVRCDPRKIQQVLINLVENALQHTPDGGHITLALNSAQGMAHFSVLDDGAGLSTDGVQRAFEAGFTTRPEGSGLGLTIARAIAHQHGGELVLLNRPSGGAAATCIVPLEVA